MTEIIETSQIMSEIGNVYREMADLMDQLADQWAEDDPKWSERYRTGAKSRRYMAKLMDEDGSRAAK